VLVDGVQYAEVQRSLERHGLDVAEGVVPELELRIQHHLLFGAACRVLLLGNCVLLLLAEYHGVHHHLRFIVCCCSLLSTMEGGGSAKGFARAV